MCGIAGIVNFNGSVVNESDLLQMINSIKHRGPDDEGMFVYNNVGLGFVRLSILDLSEKGHQPMRSSCGRYIITYNGEVYNFREIRRDLTSKFDFISDTDTEVILNAYIEWGEECLVRLNGMFAFVIYDTETGILFGARDRFGIKPFYYYESHKQFVFASEIQAILAVADYVPRANDSVLFNYLLTNRTNYSTETFFEGINKLPAGCKFLIENGIFKINKWYDVSDLKDVKGFNNSEDYLKELKRAINYQLISDVPIGISLSGGLDSTSIAACINENPEIKKLKSFSAIYERGEIGDEQDIIKLLNYPSLEMHFARLSCNDLITDLNDYINCLGEPIPSTSEYAEYKVMQLVRENGTTVLLNGQGADEVLGGYDYFYAAYFKELIFKLKFFTLLSEGLALLNSGRLKFTLKYLLFFIMPAKLQCYLFKKKNTIINDKFYNLYKPCSLSLIRKFYRFNRLKEFFLNHLNYKLEHHLLWADKSGMNFSIETRFPFIDHILIERTLVTENEKILKNGFTKHILRESTKNILSDDIRLRKEKLGFETPESKWLRSEAFKGIVKDIINSKSFSSRKYFKKHEFEKVFQNFINKKNEYSQQIWKVVHLELWLRKFIDQKGKDTEDYFVIVTPIKNEEAFIKYNIFSVVNQTIKPKEWIIVDDGSEDNSVEIILNLIKNYPWIRLIKNNSKGQRREGGSKVVNAFYVGYDNLINKNFEYIVKLDGDVVLPPNYFERIINEFKSDEILGICGGVIINKFNEDKLIKEKTSEFHVRGALKMIKRKCWNDIGGFKRVWFWDTLDVMEARFKGWHTRSVDIDVIHNRPTTSAYDPIQHAYKSGYETYKMGSDIKLTLLRVFVRIFKRPYFVVGFSFLKGYRDAIANKEKKIVSDSLAKFINRTHFRRLITFKHKL